MNEVKITKQSFSFKKKIYRLRVLYSTFGRDECGGRGSDIFESYRGTDNTLSDNGVAPDDNATESFPRSSKFGPISSPSLRSSSDHKVKDVLDGSFIAWVAIFACPTDPKRMRPFVGRFLFWTRSNRSRRGKHMGRHVDHIRANVLSDSPESYQITTRTPQGI